eukprot:TRINITY_DN24236_c0_g1_i1.p1 TRINITY_DN24236_c0_g1~~TRINITY_DN24236_c0_g1_i1.p1  ORF type:complete len:110 (-),score=4.56 TRINITY_DN24236_c0_g1_i1:474-803(-)
MDLSVPFSRQDPFTCLVGYNKHHSTRLNLDYQKGHQEHILEKEAPLNLFFLHCLHARMKRVSCRQQPDTGQQWTWLLGQKITAHIIDHHRIHIILYGGFSLFLLGALYM